MKHTLPSGWGGNRGVHFCRIGKLLRICVALSHDDLYMWHIQGFERSVVACAKTPVSAALAREQALQAAQAICCQMATEAWLKLRVVGTRLPWDGNQP